LSQVLKSIESCVACLDIQRKSRENIQRRWANKARQMPTGKQLIGCRVFNYLCAMFYKTMYWVFMQETGRNVVAVFNNFNYLN
jgi:hypothetical protein